MKGTAEGSTTAGAMPPPIIICIICIIAIIGLACGMPGILRHARHRGGMPGICGGICGIIAAGTAGARRREPRKRFFSWPWWGFPVGARVSAWGAGARR